MILQGNRWTIFMIIVLTITNHKTNKYIVMSHAQ